ncbi:ABC transporter permease subunit [bacterium]|nr:MAG: ABC transporter permease subunit [bacterium]
MQHHHRRVAFSYPTSISQRLYSAVLGPLVFVLATYLILKFLPSLSPVSAIRNAPFAYLTAGFLASFFRLLLAYSLAVVIAIPLAVVISRRPSVERVFLPVFDITQSIPVLAFFPVIIAIFLRFGYFNGAAVFILFLSMLWNIVFSVVGGLKVIPTEIISAAKVFRVRGFSFLRKVLLPAVFPYVVTGSLLAWAQGWNVTIVAEVLHTYIPGGSRANDLFGIGSILVNSIAAGRQDLFLASILVLVIGIAFLNFFIWQKLLHYTEKYRFE